MSTTNNTHLPTHLPNPLSFAPCTLGNAPLHELPACTLTCAPAWPRAEYDDTCYRLQPPDVCARCVRAQPACLRLLAYTRQPAFLPPGDFRFMHMYLEAKMPIDQLDDKHRTPLMAAARAGATYMCAMLIAKGADVRRQDRNGWVASQASVSSRTSFTAMSRISPSLSSRSPGE